MEQTTKKQIIRSVVIGLIAIFVMGGVKGLQIARAIAEGAKHAPPPDSVTAMIVQESEWPRTLSAVASLMASQGVTLSAEASGRVSKINFESGQAINKGAVLLELDSSVEDSTLRGAIALAEQTRKSLARAESLRAQNANSISDLEAAQAKAREAQAAADALQAAVDRRRVIAPFDGRLGIRMVNLGQYLNPGDAVVPLHKLDPLYINFSLPQQDVQSLAIGQTVRLTIDTITDKKYEGQISAIDPQVDPKTRNVNVQATVANPNESLRPGMFASVEVVLPQSDKLIPVPAGSVASAPYGDTIYVVEKMKNPAGEEYLGARQQVVRLGARRGDQVAVLQGLKPGDQIVTAGAFKLRPNAPVSISDQFAPANDPNPSPADS